MSRHRLASASVFLGLCCAMPLVASADGRCARGESEFCLGASLHAPAAREARASGWGHWATGSRLRWGAAPVISGPGTEADEVVIAPAYVSRIPVDAAAPGVRPYWRDGLGVGLQALDPAAVGLYGSYPLSESFSLDLTAGKGRIGMRSPGLDAAYVAASGFGFSAGPGFDRTAWSVALNATHQIGALGIGGRIGYVDVRDHPELLSDASGSALRLGGERASSARKSFLGVDASYDLGRNWQFHGAAIYRKDEGRSGTALMTGFGALQTGDEKEWGVGVRYYGWRNFKLNVEFLKTSGREQFGSESLLFMGRFDF